MRKKPKPFQSGDMENFAEVWNGSDCDNEPVLALWVHSHRFSIIQARKLSAWLLNAAEYLEYEEIKFEIGKNSRNHEQTN